MSKRRTLGHRVHTEAAPKMRTHHCKLQTFPSVILESEVAVSFELRFSAALWQGVSADPKSLASHELEIRGSAAGGTIVRQCSACTACSHRAKSKQIQGMPHSLSLMQLSTFMETPNIKNAEASLAPLAYMPLDPCGTSHAKLSEIERPTLWAPPADCQSHSLQNQLQNSPNLDSWLRVEL